MAVLFNLYGLVMGLYGRAATVVAAMRLPNMWGAWMLVGASGVAIASR
jgi:hypothetical protein